jgi:hypothetical protein
VARTWYFPNRYVNFEQFGPPHPEWGRSRFWLGNHYATRYADAQDVFERVRRDWPALREVTGAWTATLARSGLDDDAVTHFAAQLAVLRSPTCFRAADGRFLAFEGVLGASTAMWSGRYGGSCPLNCMHVWNYAQRSRRRFPSWNAVCARPSSTSWRVWTGSEYQVAAHCLREGLHGEGLAVLDAVWTRYDGRRRNPFNEIECGEHYARSLAGFAHDGPAARTPFAARTSHCRSWPAPAGACGRSRVTSS